MTSLGRYFTLLETLFLVYRIPAWSSNKSKRMRNTLLEVPNGQIVGIEVKATSSVSAADFKEIKSLAAEEPEKFFCGIVLYTGKEVLSFGEKLLAVPCL